MIPLGYTIRNILKHKITTTMTILGVSLVVFVFAAAQMLSYGLKSTLVSTGSDDNAIVIRKSSQSEVQSIILRDQGQIISTSPEIARAADGSALYTNEIYVLINQAKRSNGEMANVVVRGVTPMSMAAWGKNSVSAPVNGPWSACSMPKVRDSTPSCGGKSCRFRMFSGGRFIPRSPSAWPTQPNLRR
jgi:hypothetical protein